jgi:hypothetical protein
MGNITQGLWSLRVIGRYCQPDGTPQRGHLLFTPPAAVINSAPGGAPFMLTVQSARVDIDGGGYVVADLLHPNDPSISPGPSSGDRWAYRVTEVFSRGPHVSWWLDVPPELRDGGVVDLAQVPRLGEEIVRPGDWFPHHLNDTQVQAGRISPR